MRLHRAPAFLLLSAFALAAAAAPPAVLRTGEFADTAPQRGGEPVVKRIVVEDDGSRIEELRVRGQVQRISVQPKVGPKARYEIITGDGLRQPPAGGGNASQGAAGQRVWHVLSF